MGDEGFERPANSPRKQGFPARGNVNSDARPAEGNANGVQTDDRLARLALAWRRLDAAGQDAVVKLAEGLVSRPDDVGGPLSHSDLRTTGTSLEHASAP